MEKITIKIKVGPKKRRTPIKPTQVHKDKTKYNRKDKIQKKLINEQTKEDLWKREKTH